MPATIIAALMLFGCFLSGLPYGHFQILRWVVCGISAYRAFHAFGANRIPWAWGFVAVAVLFNPILPIHLDRDTWLIVDAVVGAYMLVSLLILRKSVSGIEKNG